MISGHGHMRTHICVYSYVAILKLQAYIVVQTGKKLTNENIHYANSVNCEYKEMGIMW